MPMDGQDDWPPEVQGDGHTARLGKAECNSVAIPGRRDGKRRRRQLVPGRDRVDNGVDPEDLFNELGADPES